MGFVKLGTTLELLQWKATYGVSDKGFDELLKLLKKYFLKTTNCLARRTKRNGLFAL